MKLIVDSSSLDELVIDIKKFTKTTNKNVMKALVASGYLIENEAKLTLLQGPTRTGRIYKRGSRQHIASAKGEPAKSDTGNLVRSLNVDVQGNNVTVGTLDGLAPYGKYLEDRNSLDRQFLKPSYDKLEPKIKQLIDRAIQGEL